MWPTTDTSTGSRLHLISTLSLPTILPKLSRCLRFHSLQVCDIKIVHEKTAARKIQTSHTAEQLRRLVVIALEISDHFGAGISFSISLFGAEEVTF